METGMKNHLTLACILVPGVLGCPFSGPAAGDPPKPNIILVLADDMGHGHVSCLNPKSKIQTPNIDRLAREGITFTDAHSGSAVCSPTRYGILTGRYAWRTRLKTGVLGPYDPPLIEAGRLTLPAMLKAQGYATACVGKWHLGWDWPKQGQGTPDFTQPIEGGPITRGFDSYFGTDVPNYPPYCFIENDRTVGQPTAQKEKKTLDGRPGPMLPGWMFDGILPGLADRAVGYLGERAKAGGPFFLYLPLTSPHEPIAPSGSFRGKSGLNDLADFIIETDAVVGRVLEAVDRFGLAEDTLLFFTADNGSSMYTGAKELVELGHDPHAGFRGAKASIYEGGHRIPFFARWPDRIQAGSKSTATICLTDFMATLAAVAGAGLPADVAEDSFNILPLLLGAADAPPRGAVVHQSAAGRIAIREGPWKLILPGAIMPALRSKKGEGGKGPAASAGEPTERELYNIDEDPAETRNVIAAHPDMEKRLADLFVRFEREGKSRPARAGD